jgi:hypothetical protein
MTGGRGGILARPDATRFRKSVGTATRMPSPRPTGAADEEVLMTKPTCRTWPLASALVALLTLSAGSPTRSASESRAQEPRPRTIRGEIKFVPTAMAFKDADLIVSVEDVTMQDVRVRRLVERKFKNVSYDGRPGSRLRFTLDNLHPNPKDRYRLRVLVDLDRNGRISRGDYRSVKAVPVLTGNDPDPVVVEAEFKAE